MLKELGNYLRSMFKHPARTPTPRTISGFVDQVYAHEQLTGQLPTVQTPPLTHDAMRIYEIKIAIQKGLYRVQDEKAQGAIRVLLLTGQATPDLLAYMGVTEGITSETVSAFTLAQRHAFYYLLQLKISPLHLR